MVRRHSSKQPRAPGTRRLFCASLFCCMGCSGADSNEQASPGILSLAGASAIGGSLGNAGQTGSGGAGGAPSSATATGAGNGSALASGGSATTGRATSGPGGNGGTGGTKAIGGKSSPGGSNSNTTGASRTTGGDGPTGGTRSSGGAASLGGTAQTGGSKTIGGSKATGGASITGGTRSAGGTATSGETKPSGGSSSSGGASGTDKCGRSAAITVPSGYSRLVWHDEFDADGAPNPANWGYETGFARNNELQWYQSKNAAVSNGLLVITGKRERVSNPNYSAGSSDWKKSRQYAEYTSASLTTSGKQTWKFGRFELCAKIPVSNGMWPAWWALGVSGEWPSNGEIDMMEFYKGKILANVACGTNERWVAKWDSATRSVDSAWAASYHFWRMDWDEQKIDLYVDESLMNSVPLSTMLNPDGKSPFLQNAYMIVNLAIGGDNGGDPANTSFPQEYLVDYLRVFQ